jgi:8-oxo-dGTP pyrophosphatase MutT (NUDIX family)
MKRIPMIAYHPEPDNHGLPVALKNPSTASALSAWRDATVAATVVPGGALPDELNGIALSAWNDVPASAAEWNAVQGQCAFDEPPFLAPPGKAPAAGVVIVEDDGRIWLAAPSNAFGGYAATFPKGRIEDDVNPQATAIREAYEETGLRVEITGFLADSSRTQTYTRYYLARRTGGNPARMGWESQAVHLVPRALLADFLTHANDRPLAKALDTAVPR